MKLLSLVNLEINMWLFTGRHFWLLHPTSCSSSCQFWFMKPTNFRSSLCKILKCNWISSKYCFFVLRYMLGVCMYYVIKLSNLTFKYILDFHTDLFSSCKLLRSHQMLIELRDCSSNNKVWYSSSMSLKAKVTVT